jgi:hypothetical protein
MTKIQQTTQELHDHLNEQLGFLLRSATSYDNGFTDEAKRLAVTIRVLVHDTANSSSLLGQLGLKSTLFLDTAILQDPANLLPYGSLIQMIFGPSGASYIPSLDQLPPNTTPNSVSFDQWWSRPIFRNKEMQVLTRKDLILSVADQDGGAHIDPALNEAYSKLSRGGAMGWRYTGQSGSYIIRPPELAAVRQIVHEVLKTFQPDYSAKPKLPKGSVAIAGVSVVEVKSDANSKSDSPPLVKVGRNDPCPCGSGKKYKNCHGAA